MDEERTETTQETGEDLLRQVLLRFTNERRSVMVSSYYSLDIIKKLMKQLNLSRRKMAEMTGVGHATINRILNGEYKRSKKHYLLAMTYVLEKYMEANNIIFDKLREEVYVLPDHVFGEVRI